MDKPYVIIHTHTLIDGNLDGMDLPEFQEAAFQLKAVEELKHGTLWIRYTVKYDGER